jgi:hypothetical protein
MLLKMMDNRLLDIFENGGKYLYFVLNEDLKIIGRGQFLKRYHAFGDKCFRSALATIPVFWSSETGEAKNCLSQLDIHAQPAKTDRRVFLAPSQMNQNAWDFASAAAFFGSFWGRPKKNAPRCMSRKKYAITPSF